LCPLPQFDGCEERVRERERGRRKRREKEKEREGGRRIEREGKCVW